MNLWLSTLVLDTDYGSNRIYSSLISWNPNSWDGSLKNYDYSVIGAFSLQASKQLRDQ